MENGLGHKGGVVVEGEGRVPRVPKSSIDRASPISLSFITSCQDLSCILKGEYNELGMCPMFNELRLLLEVDLITKQLLRRSSLSNPYPSGG